MVAFPNHPFFGLKYVGLYNNQAYKNVRNAAKEYANVLNKYPLPARTPAVITEINAAKSSLQLKINRYMENIPAGAPPAPGNVRGRMQLPRNGKINGAVVSNSSGRNFSAGNVYKVGTNFYAASKNRNGVNIWVPARRADRFNPLSKRFIKMMTTTPLNKVVNSANGKVSFVQRGTAPIPTTNKAVEIPNARLTGANKVYKYKNLFYARAIANATGRPINGRRPNVFYRVNRAANGSFAFSTNANVKNKFYVMQNNKFVQEPTYDVAQRGKFNAFVKQQLARTNLTGNNKARGTAILSAWNANANLRTLSKTNNNINRPANWSNRNLHQYMWTLRVAKTANQEKAVRPNNNTVSGGSWPPFPNVAAAGPAPPPGNSTKNIAKFINWYGTQAGLASNANRAQTYVQILQGSNKNRITEIGGGITANNNTNASRRPFWEAVVKEMNKRAPGN